MIISQITHIFAQTRLDTRAPSYMRPAGTPAVGEATLGWALAITAIIVTLIIAALVLAAVLHPRSDADSADDKDADQHSSPSANRQTSRLHVVSGLSWIYTGLAFTILILLAAFGATLVELAHAAHPPSKPALTLDITAHQWWWEVRVEDSTPSDAFVTANEVHVPVGVPIHIRLQSPDVIHSFWVPELAGKMDVIPGQLNETWMQANKGGTYRGACAEYCGLQHAHMAFAVIAESQRDYDAWAAAQRSTAASAIAQTLNGERVFVASCGGCHTVRGTGALGRAGPDLTHFASRLTIGAGLVDNTPSNLTSWITDAQAMKQGVLMPRVDLRHADVAAVVAYLNTLR